MSLLDDQEKILKESDDILKLKAIIKEKDKEIAQYKQYFDYIIKEKDKEIAQYKQYFDYIHKENAKLKQKLYDIYHEHDTSSRWIFNDSNDLLFEKDKVFI